jgi:hypothetical protein
MQSPGLTRCTTQKSIRPETIAQNFESSHFRIPNSCRIAQTNSPSANLSTGKILRNVCVDFAGKLLDRAYCLRVLSFAWILNWDFRESYFLREFRPMN